MSYFAPLDESQGELCIPYPTSDEALRACADNVNEQVAKRQRRFIAHADPRTLRMFAPGHVDFSFPGLAELANRYRTAIG